MAAPVRTVISPSRYVQGKGSIHQLGEYLKPIGSTPLLVADDLVWGLVGHDVEASLKNAGLPVQRETFRGVPSAKEVDRLVEAIKAIGRGRRGRRSAAAAPSTRSRRRASWPASGGPTARPSPPPTRPCSALSVIYTEDGEFEEYRFFPRNPDLVLVDSQVVANAPVDLLVAGVGDALATWLEARATAQSNSNTMAGGLPTLTGTALAKLSWDVLWDNALQAVDAVRDHQVTPAVEKVIEANTLLSGLGFESGGLAAAHAIHNGLTAVGATHGLAHGQKVNIGSVTQLVLEGAPASEIRDFVEFTTRVGLPNTLDRGRPAAPTTSTR